MWRLRGAKGQKKPLLCLQQQRLAAKKREEKKGEDCVWNCPSVAVVVLSHFISATTERFPPIYLPSDYSSTLLEQEKHLVSHHGWLNTINNLSFFFFFSAHAIASLKITHCLNAFFPSLNPIIFVEVQSTEKLLHFTSSARCISNCSLNTRVGCKYCSMSTYLKDFSECVWGF